MTAPHIQHLINIAREQRVLYVGRTAADIRDIVGQIADAAPHATTRRAFGAERVTFPEGGTITFATPRSPNLGRGLTVDHVFLDDHEPLNDPATRGSLTHVFGGQPERYTVIG